MARQEEVGKNEVLVWLTAELEIIVPDDGEQNESKLVEKAMETVQNLIDPIVTIGVTYNDGQIVPSEWWHVY